MKLNPKILKRILESNREFFEKELLTNEELEKQFDKKRSFFNNLFIRDIIGYIPASLNEPVLRIFEEHGELLERWLLWQSWYINRKILKDPERIQFFDGVLLYLKTLHTMASTKKRIKTTEAIYSAPKPDKPWVDEALSDIEFFTKNAKDQINKRAQESGAENAENDLSEVAKVIEG